MKLIDQDKSYRHILILESRSWWAGLESSFSLEEDLVLTFDFGLKNLVESLGGQAFYVDSLCSPEEMQKNNLLADEFFKKWHLDVYGNDIFTESGVSFGFAFRIEIWSEYLHYVRLRANLEQLKKLKYENILVGENNNFLSDVLVEMELNFDSIDKNTTLNNSVYFFDIYQYLYTALHANSLKNITKNIMVWTLSNIRLFLDLLGKNGKKTVYAQIYHPTKPIISHLLKDSKFRVITSSLVTEKGWRKFFLQRLIPIRGRKACFEKRADDLLNDFRSKRCAQMILNDGTNVSHGIYTLIERQIKYRVAEALRILKSTIKYFEKHPVHLELMIANIGLVQTIVDCVLKTKGVPSYLIINGLMPSTFGDEAKYASYINCYGIETKRNYYQNAAHVICLGDPRMDAYMYRIKQKSRVINMIKPVVSIGTSGFNPLDFNSYVAVEFEFMHDVLTSFEELKREGHFFSIIIKVRPNGVLEQYKLFVEEYFPELEIELLREVPMIEVLEKTDLYISIYSQTLFEASCLGIPAIYYKKDKEYLDAPFDEKSELVTVKRVSELKQAFVDFKNAHSRFDQFLDRKVMEKYIGPLDGKNTVRNIEFIYGLLGIQKTGALN
jgi:hypothetical protein